MDKSIFIKYFRGNLSKQEEKNMLDWLDESEANREEFLKERKLWDIILLNSTETSVNENKNDKIRFERPIRWAIEFSKMAAVFMVAVGFSIWLINRNQLKEPGKLNIVEVPIGQRVLLTLSDGSKVWLNAKSKFSYPDHFGKNNRSVELDGEALFDIVHNQDAPFVVNTPKYKVKVLGTQFNVYGYKNSNIFETTLIRGKVVLSKNGTQNSPVELKPDEQFVFDSHTNKSEIHKVATMEYITWINGTFAFNDQQFSSIVQRLERYYEKNIDVQYPELMNFRFTGKFRYSDPLPVIFDVVKKNKPFNYKLIGNKYIIYK
jgi:ferric-dicitrate binding protein FerR (iron transport regulator)